MLYRILYRLEHITFDDKLPIACLIKSDYEKVSTGIDWLLNEDRLYIAYWWNGGPGISHFTLNWDLAFLPDDIQKEVLDYHVTPCVLGYHVFDYYSPTGFSCAFCGKQYCYDKSVCSGKRHDYVYIDETKKDSFYIKNGDCMLKEYYICRRCGKLKRS